MTAHLGESIYNNRCVPCINTGSVFCATYPGSILGGCDDLICDTRYIQMNNIMECSKGTLNRSPRQYNYKITNDTVEFGQAK